MDGFGGIVNKHRQIWRHSITSPFNYSASFNGSASDTERHISCLRCPMTCVWLNSRTEQISTFVRRCVLLNKRIALIYEKQDKLSDEICDAVRSVKYSLRRQLIDSPLSGRITRLLGSVSLLMTNDTYSSGRVRHVCSELIYHNA